MNDLTVSILVDQTPEQAYAAINDVRGWWTGAIEGPTDQLGGEFSYRYKTIHYSKQKVSELVPGKKVVWDIVDSYLDFVADKREWTGSKVVFEIARKGDKTEVRFTHVGLVPAQQCFTECSDAWSSLIKSNLRDLITSGKRAPSPPA